MSTTTATPTILPVSRAPSSFVPLRKVNRSPPKCNVRAQQIPSSTTKRTTTTRRGRSPSPNRRAGTVKLVHGSYKYDVAGSTVKNSGRKRSGQSPGRIGVTPRRHGDSRRNKSPIRSLQHPTGNRRNVGKKKANRLTHRNKV